MKKDSWLYSDSFLKRAFAIYGHNLVAGIIVAVCVWVVMGMLIAAIVLATGGLSIKEGKKQNSRAYNEPTTEYQEVLDVDSDVDIDISGSLLDTDIGEDFFE